LNNDLELESWKEVLTNHGYLLLEYYIRTIRIQSHQFVCCMLELCVDSRVAVVLPALNFRPNSPVLKFEGTGFPMPASECDMRVDFTHLWQFNGELCDVVDF
jgi:hypothetical protein